MTTENKKTPKRFNQLKEKLQQEKYEPGMDNELDFLRRKYQRSKKEHYYSTRFFRKRIWTILGLFVALMITVGLTPDNPDSVLNEFSYIMMIAFLFLVAFFDQLIFGYYLFRKQTKNNQSRMIE